jgi:hypothetical protein
MAKINNIENGTNIDSGANLHAGAQRTTFNMSITKLKIKIFFFLLKQLIAVKIMSKSDAIQTTAIKNKRRNKSPEDIAAWVKKTIRI